MVVKEGEKMVRQYDQYVYYTYICIYMYAYIHSFYHLVGGGFGIAVLDIRLCQIE